jgi:hypothetical protein
LSVGNNFSLFENLQIINENAANMAEVLGPSHWFPVLPSGQVGLGYDIFSLIEIIFPHPHHLTDFRTTVNIFFHSEIGLLAIRSF